LGVTLKTAWFMSHRIREAMRPGGLDPLGGNGKIVEADETYMGKRETKAVSEQRKGRPYKNKGGISEKRAIVDLIERGGSVRTFHVAQATKVNVHGGWWLPTCWPIPPCTPTKAASTTRWPSTSPATTR
jgi:hypothetical protein